MSQITTHILDTAQGKPASGVQIILSKQQGGQWKQLATAVTNEDGRVSNLLPEDQPLDPGTYRMVFKIQDYFLAHNLPIFYPEAQVSFNLDDQSHYHIPLLLSPFGYSTYRGS